MGEVDKDKLKRKAGRPKKVVEGTGVRKYKVSGKVTSEKGYKALPQDWKEVILGMYAEGASDMEIMRQTKSIQGWYKRKNGEMVWLRSCLEYIYAKWLDSNDIEWNTEVKVLRGDGETYRPDFFIYRDGELKKIVEIKGNFFDSRDSRSEKAKRVAEKHGVELEIVFDITPYLEQSTYYHKELKLWKKSTRLFAEK